MNIVIEKMVFTKQNERVEDSEEGESPEVSVPGQIIAADDPFAQDLRRISSHVDDSGAPAAGCLFQINNRINFTADLPGNLEGRGAFRCAG